MKRKIKFKTINTAASEIKITLDNGFTVTAKSKDDFADLLENGIVFDEYDCKDYNDITISGDKDHAPSFEESANTNWINYAKSYIDQKHFGHQEYVDKIGKDSSQEVHVKIGKDEWYATDTAWYSNFDLNKVTSLMDKPAIWLGLAFNNHKDDSSISFLNRIISNQKGFLDLSNVEMPDDLTDISNFANLLNERNNGNLTSASLKLSERITKVPSFNYDVITSAKNAFKDMDALNSYPDINFPIATDVSGLLMNCQNITKISSLSIPEATDISNMLYGTSISTFGDLSLEKVTKANSTFSDINVFQTMGKVDLPNAEDVSYMFANCRNLFTTIGDISIPNATTAFGMFQNDLSLSTIGDLDLGNAVDLFAVDTDQNPCHVTQIGDITANQSYYTVDGTTYDMFTNLPSLSSIGNLDVPLTEKEYNGNLETLQSVGNIYIDNLIANITYFKNCINLSSIGTIYKASNLYEPTVSDTEEAGHNQLFYSCTSLSSIAFINETNCSLLNGIPSDCTVVTDNIYNYPTSGFGTPESAIDLMDEFNTTVRITDGVSHFQYNFDPKLNSNYGYFKIDENSVSLGAPYCESDDSSASLVIAKLADFEINTDSSKINAYGNPQGTGTYQLNAIFNGKAAEDVSTVTVSFPYSYFATVNGVKLYCNSTFKMKFNLTFGVSETIEYSIVEVDDNGNELN